MRKFFPSILLALALSSGMARGQDTVIIAAPTAPGNQRPAVLSTLNGTPQVNINTPNGAGLSYNRYQQFDIGRNNAILDNSREAVQTRLGGWVERNPNLVGGNARAILNEVNSPNPSQFNGYLEVAGQRADVIIANPSGINIDGGGFINAGRATLTTGRPWLDSQGRIGGYRVEDGRIEVTGGGLDASGTDYVGVITRAAMLNGKIVANRRLEVITGRNEVSAGGTSITPLDDNAETGVYIDLKDLGGMYADSIWLVGTAKGVGVNSVRNGGEIVAGVGELIIDANGMVSSSGILSGHRGVRVNTPESVDNGGRVQSKGNISVLAGGDIANRGEGEIMAVGDASLEAGGGVTNAGLIQSDANLSVAAGGNILNRVNGEILAVGDASLEAGGGVANAGLIQSEADLSVVAAGDIANQGAGEILAGGDASLEAGADMRNDGQAGVSGDLRLRAGGEIRNRGEILSGGHYAEAAVFYNTGLIDAGELLVRSGEIYNLDAGTIFGDHVALEAANIINGTSVDQGHAPDTRTRYDSAANSYYDSHEPPGAHDAGTDFADPRADEELELNPDNPVLDEDGWEDLPGEDEERDYSGIGQPDIELLTYDPDAPSAAGAASGIIAARDRLDIGFSGRLVNREDGLLYSGGDAFIGGSLDEYFHAAGTGGTLLNSSAVIDVAGTLIAELELFHNYNAHYASVIREIHRGDYTGYRLYRIPEYRDRMLIAGIDDVRTGPARRGSFEIVHPVVEDRYLEYRFLRRIEDSFLTESRPGHVYAGEDIRITGDLVNDRSVISAGAALSVVGDLVNIAAMEPRITYDNGGVYNVYFTWNTWGTKYKRHADYVGEYAPAPVFDYSERDIERFGMPARMASPELFAAAAAPPMLTGLNRNLYHINASPDASCLIETNPRFTDYREWLSSDFMLARMNADPEAALKRLGDGFYEQRLVREQLLRLTGRSLLDGFDGNYEQFLALMTAGVEFAEKFELSPGIALSAEMMSRLTTDLIWLEYVTVEGSNGPERVLAPRVYLAPGREMLLSAAGGIISAREVEITGNLGNAGNILAGNTLGVLGGDIHNSGALVGGFVSLAALRDINNIGGSIVGRDGVRLQAGNDINIASSLYETSTQNGGQSSSRREIDQTGMVAATGANGVLSMSAGGDINLQAARVEGVGSVEFSAGRDVNIGGLEVSYEHQTGERGRNFVHDRQTVDVGSGVYAGGDLTISAGNNLSLAGSQASAGGDLLLAAGNDVSITEGRASSLMEVDAHEESKGFLSRKTRDTHVRNGENTAIGSEASGNTVEVLAGDDFTLRGSSLTASEGLSVYAGGDIVVSAADNASESYFGEKVEKSGFFATFRNGKTGVGYGKTNTEDESVSRRRWLSSSLLGSENGDVSLYAGEDVAITASQVIAGTGDLHVSGENVTIGSQYEIYDDWRRHYEKSSGFGLTVSLSGGVGNVVDSAGSAMDAYRRMKNARTDQAGTLYRISALRGLYDTFKSLDGINAGGSPIGVTISLGANRSQSESVMSSHAETAAGSSFYSGGDAAIVARGEADGNGGVAAGTGNLAVTGSEIAADGKVILSANNDIVLQSAEERYESSFRDKSSSGGFGAGLNFGYGSGVSPTLSVSGGSSRGTGSGESVLHTETGIYGREGVEFASGNDATLKGAQVHGEYVRGTVGGDLTIESELDTASQSIDRSGSGWSVSAGAGSLSGGYNSQRQNGEADYASVNEQSGIFAGESGFDITVKGNTGLTGAAIASQADSDMNSLVTGTITSEDIENHSRYQADAAGFGAEASYDKGANAYSHTANKGSVSPAMPVKEGESSESVTKSAVAEGNITITDEPGQLVRTGETAAEAIAGLDRDTKHAHAGALAGNPDLRDILEKQAELADATARASRAVALTVGEISKHYVDRYELARANEDNLRKLLANPDLPLDNRARFQAIIDYLDNPDSALDYERWKPGGIYSTLLQGAGSALTGWLSGGDAVNAALGSMASQLAAGKVNEFSRTLANHLAPGGNPELNELVANLISNALSGGLGHAAGGEAGANAASNMNRYDHQIYENMPTFSDFGAYLSGLRHLLQNDPALFTNSDLAVLKEFFENNPGFLEDLGKYKDELNIAIAGIFGKFMYRDGKIMNDIDASGDAVFGNYITLGSTRSMWTVGLPFSSYADAKSLGDLAAMVMALTGSDKINILTHSQGARIGLESVLSLSNMTRSGGESKTINIVLGSPISVFGSVADRAIGAIKAEHPEWEVKAEVIMHPDDSLVGLTRFSSSFQTLNNVTSSFNRFDKGVHSIMNVTGIDPTSKLVIYQEQITRLKLFFNID